MKSSTSRMSWLRKAAMMLAVYAVGSIAVFAQTKSVSGTVVDDLGEPILGANVVIVGTTTGATTDMDGNFTLTGVPENGQLKVTFIGYSQQVISVAGQKTIKVTLKEDVAQLEDVVVVGYGTVKRRDLTGSVASITGEKLKANPVANVAQALQGMMPGVTVTAQDGRPGATMNIRVRGGSSISQNNDPIYIVDGVQVSDISDISADNIESMDVLKDAASTAIYGARGANGVILITTKGAKEGRCIVKYGAYYQLKTLPAFYDVQNAYDMVYGTWAYATAYNTSLGNDVAKYYGLGSSYGNHLEDYRSVSSHNYQEDLLGNANTWNHEVSVSGGTDKTKVYASFSFLDDDGMRINSGYKRWTGNFRIDQKINKKLSVDFNLRYGRQELLGNNYQYATSSYTYRPIDNPLGSNDASDLGMGSSNVEDAFNPYTAVQQYKYDKATTRVRANLGASWEIIKDLKLRSEASLSRNWIEEKTWDGGQISGYSSAKLANKAGYGLRLANTLTYSIPGLGDDHSVNLMVGQELLASKSNTTTIFGTYFPEGFTSEEAFALFAMAGNDKGQDYHEYKVGEPEHTSSFFGRVMYSYKGRYLATLNARRDGSSKFSPDEHWAPFWGGSVAWRISDENFMENTSDWLDNLKVRFSYGTTGNDNIDSSAWTEYWSLNRSTVNGEQVVSFVPSSQKANRDLKWEELTSRNLGIDFGMFNRVHGSIEGYWNETDNNLILSIIDSATGYSTQFRNVGATSNKGFEFNIGSRLVATKDFNLDLNFSYNFNQNMVEDIDTNASTKMLWGSTTSRPNYDYVVRVGEPVGTIVGYESKGYFTVDDFDYDSATGKYSLKSDVSGVTTMGNYPSVLTDLAADGRIFPGAPKFVDEDGDGEADEKVIGHAQAKHTGGFSLTGNWKAIDFSLAFTYQLGGKVYNANAMHTMYGDKDTRLGSNRLDIASKTYKYYDIDANGDLQFVSDPTALSALNRGTEYATYWTEYGLVSSEFVEDASYLRLNTLTVGYSLPLKAIKKVGMSQARIYFTGSNLFCLNKYSGLDPDVTTTNKYGGYPTPNYDYQSYPKSRSFTFGVNVTF